MLTAQEQLSINLKKEANKQGFDPVGIARIPGSHRIQLRNAALQRWLEAGNQADMKWMETSTRQDIKQLLDGVQSILAVGLNYYVNIKRPNESLNIARYGWGRDYHRIIKQRLKKVGQWLEKQRPKCQWRICVDSAPLLDKAWAEEAGLGWIGKNSNIINQKKGSWMMIGHLLCTEPLTADTPSKPLCGRCQECLQACPTKAITEPFVIDSNLCIAYHTIENKNETIPKNITSLMGKWIAGCDICQEVCPWNHQTIPSSKDEEIMPKEWILKLTKEQVLSWNDKTWDEMLRGSTLRRIKPWMWRRNATSIQETQ